MRIGVESLFWPSQLCGWTNTVAMTAVIQFGMDWNPKTGEDEGVHGGPPRR